MIVEMKRQLVFLLGVIMSLALIIALSCCNHPVVNNQQYDRETLYYKADSASREQSGYNEAISNGQKLKLDGEFFLGYKMGMSSQEVTKHSNELVQKGKLQLISRNGKVSYSYNNASSLIEFETEIVFHYHNNELYEFEIKYLGVHKGDYIYPTGRDTFEVPLEFEEFSDVYESLGYEKYSPHWYSSHVLFSSDELIKDNIRLYLERGNRTSSICFVDLYRLKQVLLEKENNSALLEDALY